MPALGRFPAAADAALGSPQDGILDALNLMVRALDIIDTNNGPADAGCHLDHAIHCVRDWLAKASVTPNRTCQ